MIPILRRYGIAPSIYRHDGYYPRVLRGYVERFGFTCIKSYTIDYSREVRQTLILVALVGGNSEIILHKMPIANLLGVTNVALFRAASR